MYSFEKVQVGNVNDQDKAQSENDSHSKDRGWKKLNKQSGTNAMNTYRKPNGQLFSQLVATQLPKLNLKYENIHKAPTVQKKRHFKYQDIKQ